ncbi:MAG TPA: glycosyltransferase, partial [Ignavibacteria bacterium]|nr:glycosyltransferase [Ignavibacteria bacterium]
FHIYGDGEKRIEFEKLIIDYGLEKSVFLKGYTKDVLSVLRTFDLFVLTSRYEGIPYVILEAMSMNIPIVTTDVGGISEVIKNKINGLLAENGNVSDISEKIIYIMENDELRIQFIDKARKDFEEKFLIENTVSQIEKIYEMK